MGQAHDLKQATSPKQMSLLEDDESQDQRFGDKPSDNPLKSRNSEIEKDKLEGTNQDAKATMVEKALKDYLSDDALSGPVDNQESTMRFNPENSIGKTMSPTFGLDVQPKTNPQVYTSDDKMDSENLFQKKDFIVRQNFHSTGIKFKPETRFAFNASHQDSARKGVDFEVNSKDDMPPSPIKQRQSPDLKLASPKGDIKFAQPLHSNRISVVSKEDQEAGEI